ncbi:MAG: rRNA adenine N-6-methyltransferase family protein [Pseudonocardiaceae bacterium]
MTDPASLSEQMLDRLTDSGELTPAWSDAFAAVPRHRFIPETIWITDGAGLVPLRRAEDPQEWMQRAYGPRSVITQVDDGHPAGPNERGRYITSSASQPNVVALMLDALNTKPGMRVLEIGTGTGYNTALLTHRLGARNVTSIEIDPDLANHARTALTATGYPATVITGDGTEGYPPHAPYDRMMSTAAVQQVPYPWVTQTRPGGTILTPWGTHYHNGALASFTVHSDGTAEGRIVGNVAFMFLRDQRIYASIDDEECDQTTARPSHTIVAPYSVAGDYDARLAIGMKVPGCSVISVPHPTAELTGTLWFVDPDTESWANLHYQPHTRTYPIHQSGPRNLWDEIEAAYHWWLDNGRPGPQRWRITISPEGQQVTLIQTSTPARS